MSETTTALAAEEALGFPLIRHLLAERCYGTPGRAYIEGLRFSTDRTTVERQLNEAGEMMALVESGALFPKQGYLDIVSLLVEAAVEGHALEDEQFHALVRALKTARDWAEVFEGEEKRRYPLLTSIVGSVALPWGLIRRLEQSFDEQGQLHDEASPLLAELRRDLRRTQAELRKIVERTFQKAQELGYAPSDLQVTIRNGRMVLPVIASHKRHVKGLIHGISATGQTLFVEPTAAFEANNQLQELTQMEREEALRVRKELTTQVDVAAPALRGVGKMLGHMDALQAIARLSGEWSARVPELTSAPHIDWNEARHPLLDLHLRQSGKRAIPFSLSLEGERRVLVVSGPNAGGKSVTLKTTGLLQWMVQCGLPVPVGPDSVFGLFDRVLADIGDAQSLEEDLSTFSGHLARLNRFLGEAGPRTLFLVDEMGSGTEPHMGASLAQAMLEALAGKGAYGVVTTHYEALKELSLRERPFVCGSMRFDAEKLVPRYELEVGKPGQSFALEVARTLGLPDSVLARAKELAGERRVAYEDVLTDLAHARQQAEEEAKEVREQQKKLTRLTKEYEDLKAHLEAKKATIVKDAQAEAKRLLDESRAKIENTIRLIRESEADREATRSARAELEAFEAKVLAEGKDLEAEMAQRERLRAPAKSKSSSAVLRVGGRVRLRDNPDTVGEIVEMTEQDALVQLGALTSRIRLDRLEAAEAQAAWQPKGKPAVRPVSRDAEDYTRTLDLRGKRAAEVTGLLTKFLDKAYLFGNTELRILHGKGDGILRNVVRQQLADEPYVTDFGDEHEEAGGAGITIVTIKA